MKKISLIFIAATSLFATFSCNTPKEAMSVKMVRSEMTRAIDGSHLDGMEGKLKWNYTVGLELKAFLDVYKKYGDESIFNYVEQWYDAIIDENGSIPNYKKENFNVDHICPGRTLFYLYDKTGKEKYFLVIERLREQLECHPRTSEGGFWHKQTYPWQMWLDGLYMAQPFYAEYNLRYEAPEKRDIVWRDIVNNFEVVAAHTYDPYTGLYRHAWDESREMFWCNKETGQSDHAWGRALGWYSMALVEVLDIMPEDAPGRDRLLELLNGICAKLPEYADPATGMWYQVLDCPGREGNYLEATCSAMFTYTYMKALRKGFIDTSYKEYVDGLYEKLIEKFIRENNDGTVSLTDCCAVAGLGGKDNRRGDYTYYINEKIVENDPKGIGPFIWASLEKER